jgi:hypothetical protein
MKLSVFIATIIVSAPLAAIGQVAPIAVTEQRNAAVGYALAASAATERMLKSCAAVPEAAAQFAETQSQWGLRNKPYVDAANGWMSYVKSIISKQKSSEVAEAFIANTYGIFSDQASMLAAELLPGSPPTAASCKKWADVFDSKKFDLEQNAEFSQDLKDIRTFFGAQPNK